MNLDKVLTDIFVRNIEHRFESAEAEREAIAAAKLGDEAATIAIMYAYAPAMRNGMAHFRYAGGVWSEGFRADHLTQELRSLAVHGLIEAIHAFNPEVHHRLASIAAKRIIQEMAELVGPVAFTVPTRTLTRFYSILRKADGDPVKAAAIATKHSMTVETFMDVLSAVRTTNLELASDEEDDSAMLARWEAARPVWSRTEDAAEDALLVEAAFDAVDDLEEEVCRLSYGFSDYDPVPDAEIGHRLGFSRAKAQRTRSSALGKMRDALAVS